MKTVGFALCGSFCTLSRVFVVVERMVKDGWDVVPILSFCAAQMDTRFGKAADFCDQLEEICGHKPLRTLQEVEPIGPKQLLDVLVVALAFAAFLIFPDQLAQFAADLRGGDALLVMPQG